MIDDLSLRETAEKFKNKLKKIKLVAFDVDGVLTNSLIWYQGEEMGFNRATHTQDGYGIKVLMDAGIKVGVISGGNSLGVHKRFAENLGLDFCFLGNEDKRESYKELINMGYEDSDILYMGDEFFDLPLLMRSGFSATTNEASLEVKERVDYVTKRSAGHGCAREVIDILRYAQDITPEVLDFDDSPIDFS